MNPVKLSSKQLRDLILSEVRSLNEDDRADERLVVDVMSPLVVSSVVDALKSHGLFGKIVRDVNRSERLRGVPVSPDVWTREAIAADVVAKVVGHPQVKDALLDIVEDCVRELTYGT